MSRVGRNAPRQGALGDGLRALATLIDETRAALGLPAAYALPCPQRALVCERSLDLGAHRPRPGAPAGRNAPAGHDAPPAGEGSGDDDTGGGAPDASAEHAEVWAIVGRAQSGDGEAFGLLYDRYVDTVFKFIYYRVNDRALAEDFTSETFLRALRRISTVNYQGRDIGAWFITIARNIVFDHTKSARHRLETTTGETIEPGGDHAPSPESAVLDAITSQKLLAAVASLNDEQRECVMLRFIHGMSVSETASIMGKNDGAIKALQHRAVRKLAEIAGDDLR